MKKMFRLEQKMELRKETENKKTGANTVYKK